MSTAYRRTIISLVLTPQKYQCFRRPLRHRVLYLLLVPSLYQLLAMMAFTLPLFPSAQARRSLTASQLVRLNESIALALQSVLDIPISKIDPTSARAFVSSYTKEAAQETLDGLLWQPTGAGPSTHAKLIRSRSLELARRLAGLPGGLSLETLTDMSIAYAQKNVSRVRDIWSSALKTHPALRTAVAADMVPSFSSLLDLNSISGVGLYGIRKTAHCVSCTVHSVPPEIISTFAKNKEFMVSLAKAYDAGLLALSRTYGGLQHLSSSSSKPEEWETIWMESKTALLDSFHVLIRHILEAVGSAQPGGALAFEADHAFEVVFGILEAASSTDRDPTVQRVPFYNQSLLADYQHAYDMKKTLGTALRRADAARMDLLDSQLRSLNGFGDSSKDPGALKLLIRSDGISSSAAGRSSARPQERAIASATAASASSSSQPMSADPNVESQVAQVRELLPDYSETYIRALLVHPDYPYCGNPERVIEALLEGTAPPSNEIEPTVPQNAAIQPVPVERWAYTAERRNVFDDEQVDMSNLRTGKKA
jgi:activating signal cointegrator complex subunit 2